MNPEKSLVESFEELREDLKGFFETRYEILRVEVKDIIRNGLSAGILVAAAGVIGVMGMLLLSICVAIAIALGLGAMTNQVGLIWGFLVVGGCEVLLAALLAGAGVSKLRSTDLVPSRTLRVLQRDEQVLREGGQQYGESERARRRA